MHHAPRPMAFIERAALRLIFVHSRETIGVIWNSLGIEKRLGREAITPLKWLSTLYWWIALTLGVIGTVILITSAGPWLALLHPFVVMWIYYAMIHAVMLSQDRYHFSSIPSIAASVGSALLDICAVVSPSTGESNSDVADVNLRGLSKYRGTSQLQRSLAK